MSTREYLDLITKQRMKGEITAAEYFNEKQKIALIETGAIIHDYIEPMAVHQIRETNPLGRFTEHIETPYFRPISIDSWGELTKYEKELLNFINEKTFKQAVNSYEEEKAIKEDNTYVEPTPQTFTSHELHGVVDSMGNYLEKLTPAINEQAEDAHKHMHETVKKEVKKLSDEVTKAQHYNAEKLENHSEQSTRLNRLSSERDRLCNRHYLDSQREIGHMQRKIDSLKTWVWVVGTLAVIELILRTILIFLTKF